MGKDYKDNKDTKAPKSSKGPKNAREPKKFTFTLSLSGLVGLFTVTVLGLVWVFIFGVLVGRGYQPSSTKPQLAHITPKESAAAAQTTPTKEKKVLKPEELGFAENLKKKSPKQRPVAEALVDASKKVEAEKLATHISSPKPQAVTPAPVKTEPETVETVSPSQENEPEYAYVYQVAAFRDLTAAHAMVRKLQGKGLSAAVETAGAWHRVLVLHQGTPSSTRTTKDILATMGIERPIIKSKELL